VKVPLPPVKEPRPAADGSSEDFCFMLPLHFLTIAAGSLLALWLVLAVWVLGARRRTDGVARRAAADARLIGEDAGVARRWSRRRLWHLADGAPGPAAAAAAGELVRRDCVRLVRRARRGGSGGLRALRVVARGGAPNAFDLLLRARAHGTRDAAAAVVAIAAELETPDADRLLLDVLVRGDHPRSRVATELAPRVPRLVGELTALAEDEDAAVRYWALMLLRAAAEERGVRAAAVSRASDPDAPVRGAVARVLGAGGAQETLPVLRSLLADESFFVRAHAARALGELGAESMAGEVAALLADESWWTRAAAKESLFRLGDAGLAAAAAMLTDEDRFARDGAGEVVLAFEQAGHVRAPRLRLERMAG
jgi:hypothetical protein